MRRKKTQASKDKDRLWELCKLLTRKVYGNNCYTCGIWVQYPHTGHFITDSTCSTELSYDLRNLRPQCFSCNIHKSGNWQEYEYNLIRDHGKAYVDDLKERNRRTKGQKYGSYWIQEKIKEYEALL